MIHGFHRVDFGGEHADGGIELVFLHGWGQTHTAFLKLARFFAARASCRLYDLPGFGQTPMLPAGAGTADYADALAAELDSLPMPKKRIVIGHSFGCRVALRLADHHPSLVDGLILIAAAGLKRKRSLPFRLRAQALKLLGRAARLAGPAAYSRYADRFGSADYRNAGALRPTFVAVVNEDLSEVAQRVNAPALLIYGEHDGETPSEFGERFASLMPHAELKVLPDFGHLDILTRGAHQCQNLVAQYLDKIIAGDS